MTLGGATFIHNGIEFDYNFVETITCLSELCDKVVVVDAGSTDGTRQRLTELALDDKYGNVTFLFLSEDEWDSQHGREKLSYFSNIAIEALDTAWFCYLQMDEIIHEKSFQFIRQAIEDDQVDAYLVRRFNLWKDCNHILNVEQARKPCSTEVIRLAKSKYRCVDDAENIGVDGVLSIDYLNKIEMYHLGFVRKKEVMKAKIHQMQVNVFEMANHDPKLDIHDVFQWDSYFSESDLITLQSANRTLPKFIQEWAKTRP